MIDLRTNFEIIDRDNKDHRLSVQLEPIFNKVFGKFSLSLDYKFFLGIRDKKILFEFKEYEKGKWSDPLGVNWLKLEHKGYMVKFGILERLNYDFGLLMDNYESNGLEFQIPISQHYLQGVIPIKHTMSSRVLNKAKKTPYIIKTRALISSRANLWLGLLFILDDLEFKKQNPTMAIELSKEIYDICTIYCELARLEGRSALVTGIKGEIAEIFKYDIGYRHFDDQFNTPYRNTLKKPSPQGISTRFGIETSAIDIELLIKGLTEEEKEIESEGKIDISITSITLKYKNSFKKVDELPKIFSSQSGEYLVTFGLLDSKIKVGLQRINGDLKYIFEIPISF